MESIMKRIRARHLPQIAITAGLLVAVLFLVRSSFTQDVATGEATGTVLSGLSVVATQDLQFGDILQGVAKTIGRDVDAASGIFTISGNRGSGLDVYLTLPDYIALADGSDRMTISFSTTDCAVDTNNATPSTILIADGFIDEDPHDMPSGIQVGNGGAGTNETRIYIGGRVTPSVDQTAGAYAGSIICYAAYNGT
jgi:hypothetical protein